MNKKEVIEQLKSLMEHCASYKEHDGDIWSKDVEALKITIEAIKDMQESARKEKICIEVEAVRSPEDENTYYYELDNGERLIIRDGEIFGIYNPQREKLD